MKECEAKEQKERETKGKAGKSKGQGGCGKKHPVEEVNGKTAPLSPPKKQSHLAKNAASNTQPWHSSHAGKGKNLTNYKLTGGKYKGK